MNNLLRLLFDRIPATHGKRFRLPASSSLVLLLALGGVILFASCAAPGTDGGTSGGGTGATADSPTARTLEGTAWQLVQIMSMDDRVFEPSERSRYTLAFEGDGLVLVRADCNRGQGTWSFKAPSQVEFGPLATTRAMCPPGSLDNRFIGDLGRVRSFVLKDGHLFLATMADGAILEFEPMAP